MLNRNLEDLLRAAKQIAIQMDHPYIGVEHLFIALIEPDDAPLTSAIRKQGFTNTYLIDTIRRRVRRGNSKRRWTGQPNTPRTDVIMGIALDIALDNGRDDENQVTEQDILQAILDEGESIPIRLLEMIGIPPSQISPKNGKGKHQPLTINANGLYLPLEVTNLLEDLFPDSTKLEINSYQEGGFRNEAFILLLATHAEIPHLVHIGEMFATLDKLQGHPTKTRPRFMSNDTITGFAAHIPRATYEDALALQKQTPQETAQWLTGSLLPSLEQVFWNERHITEEYIWETYDWLFPPLITLKSTAINGEGHAEKDAPISRQQIETAALGDTFTLENFTVHTVDEDNAILQLAIHDLTHQRSAFPIQVTDVDFDQRFYYRGERLADVNGEVVQTREIQMLNALNSLHPPFSPGAQHIPAKTDRNLPNPLENYRTLLNRQITFLRGRIHGNLHLESMLSPHHDLTGGMMFDIATLQLSLIQHLIQPHIGDSWDDVYYILNYLTKILRDEELEPGKPELLTALLPIQTLHQWAINHLHKSDDWDEYLIPLALIALHQAVNPNKAINYRRLAFMYSASVIQQFRLQ